MIEERDYTKYTEKRLFDAYSHIDKERYPDRVKQIEHEIEKRKEIKAQKPEETSSEEIINLISVEEIKFFKMKFIDRISILWGWLWRSFIVTSITMIVIAIVGFTTGAIFGIILNIMGIDTQKYLLYFRLLGGLIGLMFGILGTAYFINWITQKSIRGYRFVLVKENLK